MGRMPKVKICEKSQSLPPKGTALRYAQKRLFRIFWRNRAKFRNLDFRMIFSPKVAKLWWVECQKSKFAKNHDFCCPKELPSDIIRPSNYMYMVRLTKWAKWRRCPPRRPRLIHSLSIGVVPTLKILENYNLLRLLIKTVQLLQMLKLSLL